MGNGRRGGVLDLIVHAGVIAFEKDPDGPRYCAACSIAAIFW